MNILTFDVEEWFHLHGSKLTQTENEWMGFESRIQRDMERIFSILDQTNSKATFFCLGWIAKKHPQLIREIDSRGYEIGTHGNMHQLVYNQSRKVFKTDLEYSLKVLEDLIGKKVKYFRAPGFSINENCSWALEEIALQGIEIDCSIFPASHPHGGFKLLSLDGPSIISFNGIEIKELPVNSTSVFGKSLVFSGGGYFRIFPYKLLKKWSKDSDYIMSYFHPRDLSNKLPKIPGLPLYRKMKLNIGLKNAEHKFTSWLSEFEFLDINTAANSIEWENVKKVHLK